MGVQGLWQILEPTATPVALESLEGKRIAVDISLWLHQALQGFNQYGGETRSPHLVLLINRIAKLLFYKIRPVFVFDGDKIPIFKRHLLRDRELRRYTDQLIVNKQQKRALIEAATGSQNVGESLKKKARLEDNDIFALPEDIPNLPEEQPSSSKNYSDDKFLAGYHNLVSRDEKIAYLAEAKQNIKKTRLNDADIPADADDFSKFQTERLLQRNQLNNEIDLLRSEKAHQTAKLKDNQLKMVVVDAHARSHLLTKNHDSDVEIISPEKKKPTKVSWTEFVKQYDKKRGGEASSKKPSTSSSATVKELNSSNEPVNEMLEEDDSEDDDDVAETFRSVKEETARRRGNVGGVFQLGQIPSKTGAIDAFIGKMNALKKKGENFSTARKEASDDDSDFEEVPILAPKVASARKLTLNQMTKAKANEEREIVIDSEDENGDIEFSGKKAAAAEDLYDREDEKGVYTECQQLLTCLGLPFIVAPGEAEAQCAELERLGLVQGIVTDDSDIWLFGGKKVYKNMFSKKRNVHCYSADAIEKELNVAKLECIQLTMLSGGDYTRGFDGVGMVTALEIIAEFTPKSKKPATEAEAYDVLETIREWLDSKREFESKPGFTTSKPFTESKDRIRLRRAIEKNNDEEKIEAFPNKEVYEAYCHPIVDSNETSFKWKAVDFIALENFLWTSIGWNLDELHRKTHNAYTKWDEFIKGSVQTYQTRISGFAQKLHKSPDEQLLAPTSRVQAALKKLFKTKGINPDDLDKTPISKPPKNPLCLPPAPLPPPPPQNSHDDFFDESVDEEVFRLIEEKKKNQNNEQEQPTQSSAASLTSKSHKSKTATKKSKRAAPKKPTKPKIPPATLQPSELNLSEESSSDDDY